MGRTFTMPVRDVRTGTKRACPDGAPHGPPRRRTPPPGPGAGRRRMTPQRAIQGLADDPTFVGERRPPTSATSRGDGIRPPRTDERPSAPAGARRRAPAGTFRGRIRTGRCPRSAAARGRRAAVGTHRAAGPSTDLQPPAAGPPSDRQPPAAPLAGRPRPRRGPLGERLRPDAVPTPPPNTKNRRGAYCAAAVTAGSRAGNPEPGGPGPSPRRSSRPSSRRGR